MKNSKVFKQKIFILNMQMEVQEEDDGRCLK